MSILGAIEAGGTKFVLAVAGLDGRILERCRIDTRHPQETFDELREWFAARQRRLGTISAFGVASFGPIDVDRRSETFGTLLATPKLAWNGISFGHELACFGAPIALDTDVNAAAWGEYLAASDATIRKLAYTTIGTGIGTGVIERGQVLSGISHFESGHIRPQRGRSDDWPGNCPFHGACIEGLASGPAIKARWGHDLSSASVEQVRLVAGYVADLAVNIVMLHMPEKLVFGGGVMKTPGLIEAVRKATSERLNGYVASWSGDLSDMITLPKLADNAGIFGAIALGRTLMGED